MTNNLRMLAEAELEQISGGTEFEQRAKIAKVVSAGMHRNDELRTRE